MSAMTTPATEPASRDLLDPEVAAVVELIPFQHMLVRCCLTFVR